MEVGMIDFTKVKIENTCNSDPDGYGGELTWYYTVYSYDNKSIKNNKTNYSGVSGISETQLANLIGENLTLDLRKQIYRTNPDLFRQIIGMNREIYHMVLEGERGEDLVRLDKLRKKLKPLWAAYEKLYRDVHGSSPSRYI
jgi:hypothetical protein